MSQSLDNFMGLDGLDAPAARFFAITPANVDLLLAPKAIFVAGAGTLILTPLYGGTPVTFTVPAGFILPVRTIRVAAGSTATGIVGLA